MFERRKKRLDTIRTLLERQGAIHLKSAAETLEVSEMTVRRDIAASRTELAYLGGYIISGKSLPGNSEYKMNTEVDRNTRTKEMVGRIAASLVEQGDTVFIDCGTTTPHIVSALPEDLSLTLVCHALNIANLAARLPKVKLILLGGIYYANTMVFKKRSRPDHAGAGGHQQGLCFRGRYPCTAWFDLLPFLRGGHQAGGNAQCRNPLHRGGFE